MPRRTDHHLPPELQPYYAPNNNALPTGGNNGPRVAEATPAAYSCPFRARNGLVFNANDFPTCAHSFKSISLVKRHIRRSHKAEDFTTQCQVCTAWFTKKAFEAHQMNQSCFYWQLPAVDRYDKGITKAMALRLSGRGGRGVLTWKDLCQTIFPGTAAGNIPPGFERILEAIEACEQANQAVTMGCFM